MKVNSSEEVKSTNDVSSKEIVETVSPLMPEIRALESSDVTGDSDQYQDSRLSEKSDDNIEDSDSSTPHQVDNDDDNSLASIPQPAADEEPDDASFAQSSITTSHQYYNTKDGVPDNIYYNDTAALQQTEDKIKIDPDDYESMYSIKRDLDMLNQSSTEVLLKINSLGTDEKKKGKLSRFLNHARLHKLT